MDVFGHDDVAKDAEVIRIAHGFKGAHKQVAGFRGAEVGPPLVATEGDEVEVAGLLITDEFSHVRRVEDEAGIG